MKRPQRSKQDRFRAYLLRYATQPAGDYGHLPPAAAEFMRWYL